MMTDNNEHKEVCFFCNQYFNFSNHKYYGKYLSNYQLNVCDSCLKGNWDGLNPDLEDKFEKHLKTKNLPIPKRNTKGWYPLS
jgi:hypothetical protein